MMNAKHEIKLNSTEITNQMDMYYLGVLWKKKNTTHKKSYD